MQKAQVAGVQPADVVDLMLYHGQSFYAQAGGKAAVDLRIAADGLQHIRANPYPTLMKMF